MICKDNQKMIDTVLRLKSNDSDSNRSNKIASIMAKPDYQRTKEENQELTISIIQEMVRKETNRQQNKIASSAVTSTKQKQVGEVAELQRLLKTYIH